MAASTSRAMSSTQCATTPSLHALHNTPMKLLFVRVAQPALSSSSTMMRSRPAPASRANRASSAAKNGLEMPFETYQNTSPEIGWTKAVM